MKILKHKRFGNQFLADTAVLYTLKFTHYHGMTTNADGTVTVHYV